MIWVAIIVALVVGIGAGVALNRRQSTKALPPGERLKQLEAATSVRSLGIGDIVVHYDREYLVEGRLTYTEEGFSWHEYLLVDGDDSVWLVVEDDDRLFVGLARELDEPQLSGVPGETLTVDGVSYRQTQKGRARMTREGQTGSKSAEVCTYFEYSGPGTQSLSVEQWGQGLWLYAVEEINEAALDILPGSERRGQ